MASADVDEPTVLRAWCKARDIIIERQQKLLEEEKQKAAEDLDRADAETRRALLESDFYRRQVLNVMATPPPQDPPALAPARVALKRLERTIRESSPFIPVPLPAGRRLVISGRALGGEDLVATREDIAAQFEFYDRAGRRIAAPPIWARRNKALGIYSKLLFRPDGWFSLELKLPQDCGDCRIRFADIRSIAREGEYDDTPIALSHLDIFDDEGVVFDNEANFVVEPADRSRLHGMVRVPNEGIRALHVPERPYYILNLSLLLSVFSQRQSRIAIEVELHDKNGVEQHRFESRVFDRFAQVPVFVKRDEHFSQAVVTIKPVQEGDAMLVSRTIMADHIGRIDRAANMISTGAADLRMLEGLAADWKRREAWYGVMDDLERYDRPLILVRETSEDEGTLIFQQSFSTSGRARYRGATFSVGFFDKRGAFLHHTPAGFRWSDKIGAYQYIETSEGENQVLVEIHPPANARYVSAILRRWDADDLLDIDAKPTFVPARASDVYEIDGTTLIEEAQMGVAADAEMCRHGLVAISADGTETPLAPNNWRSAVVNARELRIVLADDEEFSPWRGIDNILENQGASAFRKIIATAWQRSLPVTIDLSGMAANRSLPFDLFSHASRAIVRQDQVEKLSDFETEHELTLDILAEEAAS